MNKRRVKYYGLSDLASSYYMTQAREFLENYNFDCGYPDINDVLECYNILHYVKSSSDYGWPVDAESKILILIRRFLKNIQSETLETLYLSANNEYYTDFWELYAQYNLSKKFDSVIFETFLFSIKPEIRSILQVEKVVAEYDVALSKYLCVDANNATIILDILEVESTFQKKNFFLPRSFSLVDKENLIKSYIESDNPNLNYLEVIQHILNRDVIRISDRTRLLAKRQSEIETEKFFKNSTGFTLGVSISYSESQKDSVHFYQEEGVSHLSYSYNWIKENLDYSTILNNFIYLFEFADDQMRITLTSKQSDIGTIENIFGTKAKNNYQDGWVFKQKEQISNLQLYSYFNLLSSLGVDLEEVIRWFFSKYMFEQFGVHTFTINLPSKNTTYLDKCRILAPEIESILKKFNLLIEDNYIDLELLEISSSPLLFKCCKSFFEKKYVYPNSDDFKTIFYLLFSDQCMLNYIEKGNASYHSFFELMRKRVVSRSDYPDYLQTSITWLIDKGFLIENDKNELIFKDLLLIWIIKELHYNEVINYSNCHNHIKVRIDELVASKYLMTESSLFSRDEQHYFNYYLNKSEHGNSLDIRNMYVHGTHPATKNEQEIHKLNYFRLLKVIILIVIKINDELCNKNLTTAST